MPSPDHRGSRADTLVERPVSTARIRFSADILRRLGEELNPHLDKGIVELVKNAYDADATWCRIELCETDRAGGSIVVTDNGDGMTPAGIERGWLVLGSSAKAATAGNPPGPHPGRQQGVGAARRAAHGLARAADDTPADAAKRRIPSAHRLDPFRRHRLGR